MLIGSLLCEGRQFPALQQLCSIEASEQLAHHCNRPGPPGLMARSQPRTVVAMEIFVEQEQVAPMRVVLEFLRSTIHGAPAMIILQENAGEAVCELPGNLEQVHHPA